MNEQEIIDDFRENKGNKYTGFFYIVLYLWIFHIHWLIFPCNALAKC